MEFELSPSLVGRLGPELRVLAWLLTYSLHASILATVAVLLTKSKSVSAAARDTVWKAALLTPLLTTLLSSSIAWPLLTPSAGGTQRPKVTVAVGDTSVVRLRALAEPSTYLTVDEHAARRLARLLDFVGAATLAAAALGLARYGLSAAALRRHLAGRRRLTRGRSFERLQVVLPRFRSRGIALSECADIESPLVLGGSEICVPEHGLSELTNAELEAVFAHELAHLERGDGYWFPVVGLLQSALWPHPVTRWVCAQVRQNAELACDARCVELTGRPRALAAALTHLAARALAARHTAALPTMTLPRSGLVARVAQLTSTAASRAPQQRAPRLTLRLALAAVVSLALGVRVVDARALSARPNAAPDLARLSQEAGALAVRRAALELELQQLSASSTGPGSELAASVRALEIEQELSHSREMQRWLEERSSITGPNQAR